MDNRTPIRRSTSTSIVFGHGTTVADLIRALEPIPGEARVSVKHYNGDQRDPAETTITATWDL